MRKKEKIIISLAIFVPVLIWVIFFSISNIEPKEITNPISKTYGVNTILDINGIGFEEEIKGSISVYDFMSKLRQEGKINFTEKNYIGMGKFIETIDGVKGNGDQNWIYYVNGKKALVGVSNYKIKSGDIVSWKYEKNY